MYFPFSPCIDLSNIWRGLHTMKLLIVQFSPAWCYFLSLIPNYSPQHSVLESIHSMLFLQLEIHVLHDSVTNFALNSAIRLASLC